MQALDTFQSALDRLRSGELGVHRFSSELRDSDDLLGRLPERYSQALFDLLDRLESSALFSEESCSFSQSGLLDNVQVWIDKARAQLASQP